MLEEFRYFLEIAETGTFTEAARRAHLTQPALSAAIARLEALVGARLFDRAGGRGRAGGRSRVAGRGSAGRLDPRVSGEHSAGKTRLTAAGEALLPRARAALGAFEEGKRAVGEVLGLRAGEVRLGGGATACTYYLPEVLTAFRREHPGILLRLREATTTQVQDAIAAGELDLGIITDPRGEHWLDDPLILVAGPDYVPPAASGSRRSRPPRIDPATAPFVTFPKGAATRELLERHFPDARVVMELSGIASVIAFVRAGVGLALLSRAAASEELRRGTLVEVKSPQTPLVRELYLVHNGEQRLAPAAAALRQRLLAERMPGGKRKTPAKSSG